MLIQVGIAADIKGYDIIKRVYSPEGKSPTLTTMGGGHREPKIALDVLEEKSQTIKSQYYKSSKANFERKGTFHATGVPYQVNPSKEAAGKQPYMQNRVFSEEGKSHSLTASFASRTNVETKKLPDKSKVLKANYYKSSKANFENDTSKGSKFSATGVPLMDSVDELHWRKLTPLECERLQTVPDNYTEGVSNTQRYKMLGNGWTVDVIAHILKSLIKS